MNRLLKKRVLLPIIISIIAGVMAFGMVGCTAGKEQTADQKTQAQQENLQRESQAQVGLPSIKNFREKKLLKDIYELRDQEGLMTYTYIFSEMTGKLIFLGESVGYGVPYSAQFSNPEKVERHYDSGGGNFTYPQAEPNGLFSPGASDATWVLLKAKNSDEIKVTYVEPRIVVSPVPLH